MRDCTGNAIDDLRVEELASQANISLRSGCFCNPGVEAAHGLSAGQMRPWFGRDEPATQLELREGLHCNASETRLSGLTW